jgi:RNAse (barnase) inhibitor barstar
MRTMTLDASSWKTISDFYDALLSAIGAPDWHGRNINAVVDSMVVGDINSVEPPYTLTIINITKLPEPIQTEVTRVADAILEARKEQLARTGENVTVSLQFAWL